MKMGRRKKRKRILELDSIIAKGKNELSISDFMGIDHVRGQAKKANDLLAAMEEREQIAGK